MRVHTLAAGAFALAAAGIAGITAARASRAMRVRGKTALVCGASRGLGRAIALELARRGCRVAICARNADDLETVRSELSALGVQVHAQVCDLRRMNEVESLVANVGATLGPIDLLVANAATIAGGPIETMTVADFDDAMESIFKTALHAALAVMPQMRARRSGTIAFITSIGGKISVPHLLPYSTGKFAEVALAEGLRAESAKDGIHVLTVVPGLMRTGSHVHALFKGDVEKEYALFGASATSPMPITIDAARAARRIVRAIQHGDSEIVLTPAAKLAVRAKGLAPGLFSSVMSLVGRMLPRAPALPAADLRRHDGLSIEASSRSAAVAIVQRRGRPLSEKNNQLG